MGEIERGVWHKDGPVAQIESMAEWLDHDLDAEHVRKVQANLRAAASQLRGVAQMSEIERKWTIRTAHTIEDEDGPTYVAAHLAGPEQREVIEVVPVSQLEGAVEALRELRYECLVLRGMLDERGVTPAEINVEIAAEREWR